MPQKSAFVAVLISAKTGQPLKRPPRKGTPVFFGMRRPGKQIIRLAVKNFWTEPPKKKGGKVRRVVMEYPQAYTKTDYKNLKKTLAAGKTTFVVHERRLKTLLKKPDGSTVIYRSKKKGARGRPRHATKLDFGSPRGRGATSPLEVRLRKRWVRLDGFRQRDKYEKRQFHDLVQARKVGPKRFELDEIEIRGKTIKETMSRVTFPFDVPYLKKHNIDLITAAGTVTVLPEGARRSFACTFKKRQDFATVVSREIRKALAIGAGSGRGQGSAGGGFGWFFTDLVDIGDFIEAAKENLADQLAKGKKNSVDADMAVDRFDRTVASLERPGMKPLKALKQAERLLVSLSLTLHKRPQKRPPSGKPSKKRPSRRPAPRKLTRPTRRPVKKPPTRPVKKPPTRPVKKPPTRPVKKPLKRPSRKIPQKKGKSHVVRKPVTRRVAGRSRHPGKAKVGSARRKLAPKRGRNKTLPARKVQTRKRVSDKRHL